MSQLCFWPSPASLLSNFLVTSVIYRQVLQRTILTFNELYCLFCSSYLPIVSVLIFSESSSDCRWKHLVSTDRRGTPSWPGTRRPKHPTMNVSAMCYTSSTVLLVSILVSCHITEKYLNISRIIKIHEFWGKLIEKRFHVQIIPQSKFNLTLTWW